MRSILIHADASPAMEARFQAGLDIARLFGGHVRLHTNTPLQRFVAMDPFGGTYVATGAIEQARADEEALIDEFSKRLTSEDVPWSIESSSCDLVDGLLASAGLAELVIISLGAPAGTNGPNATCPVEPLATQLRTPLLALPSTFELFPVASTALVAWNGSQQAANALRAALPLLGKAEQVVVGTIMTDGNANADGFPATDALEFLSLHDIHAELVEKPKGSRSIEESIEDIAQECGADWLVMGAFGHGRWREALFGGVTRYFIDAARWPLLLAH